MVTTVSNLTRGRGNDEGTTIVSAGLPEGVKKIYNPIILPLPFGFVGIKKLAYPIVLLILFICNSRSIGVGAKIIQVLNALGHGCSNVQANNTVFGLEGLEDGSKYEGEFRDGKPHGQGTITYQNGNSVTGIFVDGNSNNARFTTLDGQVHTGSMKGSNHKVFMAETETESVGVIYINGEAQQCESVDFPGGAIFKGIGISGGKNIGIVHYTDGSWFKGEFTKWDKRGAILDGNGDLFVKGQNLTKNGDFKEGICINQGSAEVIDLRRPDDAKDTEKSIAVKNRFYSHLISDPGMFSGMYSYVARACFNEMLTEIGENKHKLDNFLKYFTSCRPSDLDANKSVIFDAGTDDHERLIELHPSNEGENKCVLKLYDSAGFGRTIDDKGKAHTCWSITFSKKDWPRLKMELKNSEGNDGYAKVFQRWGNEPVGREQRLQKNGACTIDCLLSRLFHKMSEKEWVGLRIKMFKKAKEFFQARLEGETDPFRIKCIKSSIQMAKDKITNRRVKLERLTKIEANIGDLGSRACWGV